MRVGVPKEIKNNEYRVGLVPSSVAELVHHGHEVLVEAGAWAGVGDSRCGLPGRRRDAGRVRRRCLREADLVVKVKEPLPEERRRLRRGQVLFTYLHLAPDLEQTRDLSRSGATCIAYETVTSPTGGLPLLTPMSEVAGRLAPQVGAHCLEKAAGGRGVLLGGVPGVPAAEVVILGGGVVRHACRHDRARHGRERHPRRPLGRCAAPPRRRSSGRGCARSSRPATPSRELVQRADLLIGCVLVPGAARPSWSPARC